jgi:hypothetical protein
MLAKCYRLLDNWVFEYFLSSGILKDKKFWKLDLFSSSDVGLGDTYSVGPLERKANLNHWTSNGPKRVGISQPLT